VPFHENDANPVTSFRDTGFGAWADGTVAQMFPPSEEGWAGFTFDRVSAVAENPAENPKIAITRARQHGRVGGA